MRNENGIILRSRPVKAHLRRCDKVPRSLICPGAFLEVTRKRLGPDFETRYSLDAVEKEVS